MPTTSQPSESELRSAAMQQIRDLLAAGGSGDPQEIAAISRVLAEIQAAIQAATPTQSPEEGFSAILGIGPDAAANLGAVTPPRVVTGYDNAIDEERVASVGDLYYIYQHEKLGVFRVVQKLQELFRAGTVKLDSAEGAFNLYRYDRRQVLRYKQKDRMQAYNRVFGYTKVAPARGAQPNGEFHALFTTFIREVAKYWRDKRVSEVIRTSPNEPTFGSTAKVRRAGLDLRNNIKRASNGYIVVLRVEVQQLLDEAFNILDADDVKNLFGADDGWDVVEEVQKRYFGLDVNASRRNRLAYTGRAVIHWLSRPAILDNDRAVFEQNLDDIGEPAEEWITSEGSIQALTAGSARVRRPGQAKTSFE